MTCLQERMRSTNKEIRSRQVSALCLGMWNSLRIFAKGRSMPHNSSNFVLRSLELMRRYADEKSFAKYKGQLLNKRKQKICFENLFLVREKMDVVRDLVEYKGETDVSTFVEALEKTIEKIFFMFTKTNRNFGTWGVQVRQVKKCGGYKRKKQDDDTAWCSTHG